MRKVSQSIRRKRGAETIGKGAGLAGGGPFAVGADVLGGGWFFAGGCFGLSLLISILRFRHGKRAHTRSRTAAICPFKSVSRRAVLEPRWQIGDGALIAEDHGHYVAGVRPAAKAVANALVVQNTEQNEGCCRGCDPAEAVAEVMADRR